MRWVLPSVGSESRGFARAADTPPAPYTTRVLAEALWFETEADARAWARAWEARWCMTGCHAWGRPVRLPLPGVDYV